MNESGKVLLADDEDLFRDTTADLLRQAGYAVDCACDAAQAASMLAADQYDLLISDIKMPGNTDLQLVLEANEVARGLPIILLTGYPEIRTAVDAVRLAVVVYLIKPVLADELLSHVRASIARGRLYRTAIDLRSRLRCWDGDVGKLEEALRQPLGADVTEPARSLLAAISEIVAKALVDLRQLTRVVAAADRSMQPGEVQSLVGKSEMVENALRETIQALEESKYVFKSKRLKELRQQLQGVLGVLEQDKARSAKPALAPPHWMIDRKKACP